MHVAHEAALALHHNRVEEAGTLHGGAERAPAWPGRPWETTALSRRLPSLRLRQSSALAGGCAGANGTGREEGPAGIVRWIPRHPPSSIPPAGTRGCHGQAQRAKGDPRFPNVPERSGQPSAALASDPAPASPGVCHAPPSRHHFCLSLTQHGSDNRGYDPPRVLGVPAPWGYPSRARHHRPRLQQDFQGRSTAPEDAGWVQLLPNLRASTHMPVGGCLTPCHPLYGHSRVWGKSQPGEPRGHMDSRRFMPPAPLSHALLGCTPASPRSRPCSSCMGFRPRCTDKPCRCPF